MARHGVVLMGGLGGSSLALPPTGDLPARAYWVDPPAIALGGLDPLRLDAGGVGPDPPDMPSLKPVPWDQAVPGKYLTPFYADALADLTNNAPDDTWDVDQLPYDWRFALSVLGSALAAKITADVGQGNHVDWTLVGHSYGGLVARWCWAILNQQGHAAFVRRIVTVATPHFGSFAAALSCLASSASVLQIARYFNWAPWLSGGTGKKGRTYLANLISTWPGFWSCFPFVSSPTQPQEEGVAESWRFRANWPRSVTPSDARFADPAAVEAFLTTPANIPPPSVMCMVTGSDYLTPWNATPDLNGPDQQPTYPTVDGDGIVAFQDQFLPGYTFINTLWANHGALPNFAGRNKWLSQLAYASAIPAPGLTLPFFGAVIGGLKGGFPLNPGIEADGPNKLSPGGFDYSAVYHDP